MNALALVLLWPARGAAAAVAPALRAAEGRLALAGWLLGSLGFAGAVLAADSALAQREAARARAVLGSPAPAASPAVVPASASPAETVPASVPATTSATPPPAGDLKYYQDLAKRLQETLDDPQKLNQYFAAKAAKDFEKAPVQTHGPARDTPFKGSAKHPSKSSSSRTSCAPTAATSPPRSTSSSRSPETAWSSTSRTTRSTRNAIPR